LFCNSDISAEQRGNQFNRRILPLLANSGVRERQF
jgi:hypothetical protein